MDENIYEKPGAELLEAEIVEIKTPHAFIIALQLLGLTFLMGLLLTLIEYLIGYETSGTSFMTTIIPCLALGTHYGTKRGELFSKRHRLIAITYYFVLSLILAAALIFFTLPEFGQLISQGQGLGIFIVMLAILLPIGFVVAYFFFQWGEKLGIKNWEKKNKS